MKIKHALGLMAIPLILVGAGCASTPEQKIQALQNEKTELRETSGYNECIRQVDAELAKHDACIDAKLHADGYTDGMDCISEYGNPPCDDTTRYNAQVEANNECIVELENPDALTKIDCMDLLTE